MEFAGHEVIAQGFGADIYFAHPCASWARGINENTHGLIRQYFPKGTDFNEVSDEQIKQVMDRPCLLRQAAGRSIIELEKHGAVDRRMNYLWGSKRSCLMRNRIALNYLKLRSFNLN